MFEQVFEFMEDQWDEMKVFEIVPQTHSGIVLRLGKFHRRVSPGVAWKIPYIDDMQLVMNIITTLQMDAQSLTTLDGKGVVVSCIIKFKVVDPKPYLLEIYDSIDVLQDTTMGAVAQAVSETSFYRICEVREVVERMVKRETKEFGFEIHKITFTDFGPIKTIRLIQDTASGEED